MFLSRSAATPQMYLYNDSFSPDFPELNLLEPDDRNVDGGFFQFTTNLQINVKRILVITTFAADTVGEYTLTVSGLNKVNIVFTDNTSAVAVFNVTTSST